MKFPYFANFQVDIDPRAVQRGGSFCSTGAYAPQGLQKAYDYLRQFENPVLIDVGANSGSYTLLTTLIPTLRVIAFEPVKESRKLLTKHVRMNGVHERVTIIRYAVGERNTSKANLYTVTDEGTSALSMVNGSPATHKQVEKSSIRMVTLDSVFKHRLSSPTLIKIDTEGGEYNVLMGMQRLIKEHMPTILCEASEENLAQYGHKSGDIDSLLLNYGYLVGRLPDGDLWAELL